MFSFTFDPLAAIFGISGIVGFFFIVSAAKGTSSINTKQKNEKVKKAFENIKQICIDLKEETNCPEEDLKDFLKFISKQWNK